ncbi:MAG TPA: major capsid protein [Azospirillaceae bacterium]|nr:major capsid protein [Azospirillaceae bacterium]
MATLDIFRTDAFRCTTMTTAVDRIGYVPGFLGSIPGLFIPKPVRTTDIWIEERGNTPALIQTSSRGEPVEGKAKEKRTARSFQTLRLADKRRITAAELQNIRAFGSESELKQVMGEVAERQAQMKRDFELTMENWRLACVQGKVIDADSTVIYDWATQFGQTKPDEVDFDLDNANPASGAVRKKCNGIVRTTLTNLKGLGGNGVEVIGLAGDNFWDDLTSHKEVRETYLNTLAAAELRTGNAYEQFRYGGITWINYRGSDDGKVAVGTDKAIFFPANAGIFQMAYAPAESFDFVNTLGLPLYSWVEMDKSDHPKYADVEMYSYPLPVCVQPSALCSAKRT